MGAKEILNRLKKMESGVQESDNITVVCLVDGVEKRKIMPMCEAQERIMKQSSSIFWGKGWDMNNRIIGVEYEGSDGFLECMLEAQPADPEEMMRIVDDEGEMARKSIIARLEDLEKNCGSVLPLVKAKYANGDVVDYYGLPPIDDLFRDENPIMQTFGSEFAELVNTILHPCPNRNIEDFEGEPETKRPEPQSEPVKEVATSQTIGNEMQQLIRRQKEERRKKDKERADKANAVNRIVT